MSTLVTGRFYCLIQAEEAMSESLLRFPREDVVLVPPPARQDGRSFVLIRAKRHADRRLAVRTLQWRGAEAVEVVVMAASARADARIAAGVAAAA
jgi:hypothetical protein